MIKKERTEVLKNFSHKNKDLLCIFCNPATDEIIVSFDDKSTYVKFPENKKIEDNVVFRTLFDSLHFRENANDFLVGLFKGVGTDEKLGNQFYQAIGGSIQSINEEINGNQEEK